MMEQAPQNSRAVVEASRSNFASSFWFLPKEKREALNAIYAYCRLADDAVDLAHAPEEGRARLDQWRKETLRSFKQEAAHPVLRELSGVAKRYAIPEEYFEELLTGVGMDLDRKSYRTFEELYPYCYRVASVVGLMCLQVFGWSDPKSKDYAVDLGVAFQLTNILRDVRTDAERGRVYIPEEDLEKFSLKGSALLDPAGRSANAGNGAGDFPGLMEFECRRAEHYYRKARASLKSRDRSNLAAAEVMSAVYHAILAKIRRDPSAVLREKIKLSRNEALLRAAQGWLVHTLHL